MGEYFVLALLAGLGVAVAAAPFGCFLMWRRMAFAADSLAHASLLGVALALLAESPPLWGIAPALAGFAAFIFAMRGRLSLDALSHVGAHAALAFGVLLLAATRRPVEWERYLFGDILSLTRGEALFTALTCGALAAGLWALRRPLLSAALTPGGGAHGPSPAAAGGVCVFSDDRGFCGGGGSQRGAAADKRNDDCGGGGGAPALRQSVRNGRARGGGRGGGRFAGIGRVAEMGPARRSRDCGGGVDFVCNGVGMGGDSGGTGGVARIIFAAERNQVFRRENQVKVKFLVLVGYSGM